MRRATCLVLALLPATFVGAQDKKSGDTKPPDGVYAVLRDSLKEKDLLPLKEGERMLVNRHRYLKKDNDEPSRYLVVHKTPAVELDLVGAPKPITEGKEIKGLLLKLRPKAATALEQLTTDRLGKSVTIVIGGDVVTMHKIRSVIKNGDVQVTNCAPGSAQLLLDQLVARQKKK